MCNHSAVALVQEKISDPSTKQFFCFRCQELIGTDTENITPAIDLRYFPIEYVKKMFT
ncbi:hypothetical protein ACFL5P_04215 [candidate division KSB1 bacterium]